MDSKFLGVFTLSSSEKRFLFKSCESEELYYSFSINYWAVCMS
jgi:hypothetical protein